MNIDGNTKLVGFFGSTYKTSKMYQLYNIAFEALKLNYVYIPFVVDDLKKAVDGIKALNISGVGVTIPYKIAIIPFLDMLDVDAKRIGAVNVVINSNGRLIGGNTDGAGGLKALKEQTVVKGKKVILLGAGGASRALAFSIKDEGGKLTILSRTLSEAEKIAKAVDCRSDSLDKLAHHIKDVDIVINSTSVGMSPNSNESIVPKTLLRSGLIVFDIVSNPKETKLLKEAKEAGCKTVYAARMLLWQAVLKFKLFTGVNPPIKVMEKALFI